MSTTQAIIIKKPNKDSIEEQQKKLGLSNYLFNKRINKGESFYSSNLNSLWIFECETCNVFLRVSLDMEKQLEISKNFKNYKILSIFNVSTVNGYYVCITEKGKILRMRNGDDGGEETTLGEEYDSEKELYEKKLKKNNITYYKPSSKLSSNPNELLIHHSIGETFCEVILESYLGLPLNDILKEAKTRKAYIRKGFFENSCSKINFRHGLPDGQFTFLWRQTVQKKSFLEKILPQINLKLSKLGFKHDKSTNTFIREIGDLTQVFELYNQNSDGKLTIVLNPRLRIVNEAFTTFRRNNFEYLNQSNDIGLSFNCYTQQKKIKFITHKLNPSINYDLAISIFIDSIDNLVIPFFDYFSLKENITNYINFPWIKVQWLLFIEEKELARELLASFYYKVLRESKEKYIEIAKEKWDFFFPLDDITEYQSETTSEIEEKKFNPLNQNQEIIEIKI